MRNGITRALTLITFIAPWPSLGHDMVNMIERACLTSRFSFGVLTAMAPTARWLTHWLREPVTTEGCSSTSTVNLGGWAGDFDGLGSTPQEVTSMLSNVFHLRGSFKEDNACHQNERSCNFFQRNAHTKAPHQSPFTRRVAHSFSFLYEPCLL